MGRGGIEGGKITGLKQTVLPTPSQVDACDCYSDAHFYLLNIPYLPFLVPVKNEFVTTISPAVHLK